MQNSTGSTTQNTQASSSMSITQQIASASCGAIVTTFVVTPFDVIKTQMQVNRSISKSNPTTIQSVQYVIRNSGARGLWRGLTPSLIMQVPGTGLYYSIYEYLKDNLGGTMDGYSPLLAGSIARVCATFATSPLELARTIVQANVTSNNKSDTRSILSHMFSTSTKLSPWTGLGITLLRDAPFSAIYWFTYEALKRSLIKSQSTTVVVSPEQIFLYSFISGAASGMISAIVTNPLDVIKSEIQSNGFHSSESNKKTIWGTVKSLYKESGWTSFTRGMVPRTAKVAPACAIMISSYEIFKQFYATSSYL